MVADYRAFNVNVKEQEEHLPGVRHWDLPATEKDQSEQPTQAEQPATQETWVPSVSV